MNNILSVGEKIFKVLNYTFLLILAIVTLYPLWFVIVGAFSDPSSMFTAYFFPKDIYYANFYTVFGTPGIGQAYLISILRIAVSVPAMLLVTGGAAFALTRKKLMFRKSIIIYFFITMFFSGGLIPYYMTIKAVGLYNTFWVFVIPFVFNVWTMIIMKTSIQSLPESLIDIALIDGANHMQIFFKIILPLSKAMLAVMGLFSAVGWWNDWFTGAFFVEKAKLKPLQTFLQTMILKQQGILYFAAGSASRRFGLKDPMYQELEKLTPKSLEYAYIVATTVPILLVYPFIQKYFVKGVLIGSIKG